jgi:aspartyl-tRNA(Asn)/glutamyl-tRNA(Gln) amidotransferase subunit A
MKIEELTIDAVREQVASGAVTATELAHAHYDKIAATDPQIGAYLTLCRERAEAQAAAIDEKARKGDPLPVLAGVPVGIKDALMTEGVRTTAASKILDNFIAPYTATSVARMEAAGAVVLGKLNCDEFAMGGSNENSGYWPVHNPHDLSRVPGGSSGGSAAAVAANMAVATLGSDTGGSIRQPASFCGVVGLTPTYGRVSRYGLIAFASSLDHVGPLTKNVKDAATVLNVIAGRDEHDSTSANVPVEDYTKHVGQDVKGLRLGVPEEYFGEGLDPEVRQLVEKGIDQLRAQGCTVEKVSLPHTKYAIPTYYIVATAEASANLARFDGVRYGHRTDDASSLQEMYRKSRDEGFGPEVKRRIILGTYALSSGYYDAYYLKAQKVRTILASDFEKVFAKVDAIVTPTAPTPAFKIGEKSQDPLAMYLGDIFTVTADLVGIPALSVPCGNNSEGLPVGLQIQGRHFDEGTLLRLAYAVEQSQK